MGFVGMTSDHQHFDLPAGQNPVERTASGPNEWYVAGKQPVLPSGLMQHALIVPDVRLVRLLGCVCVCVSPWQPNSTMTCLSSETMMTAAIAEQKSTLLGTSRHRLPLLLLQ